MKGNKHFLKWNVRLLLLFFFEVKEKVLKAFRYYQFSSMPELCLLSKTTHFLLITSQNDTYNGLVPKVILCPWNPNGLNCPKMTRFPFWRCRSESLSHSSHQLGPVLGQDGVLSSPCPLRCPLHDHLPGPRRNLCSPQIFKSVLGEGLPHSETTQKMFSEKLLSGRSSVRWVDRARMFCTCSQGLRDREGRLVCVPMWPMSRWIWPWHCPTLDAKQAWLQADKHY